MSTAAFEFNLQELVRKANKEGVPIDDLYKALHGQALIAEVLLKVEIEQAYKERFK